MQETLCGCRIRYDIARHPSSDAPRILLLHGWGCDSSMFSFISDALGEVATVVTMDFPGHGQSEEPPEPWGVSEYTEQVRALVENHELAPVQIVAHSFGGRIAIKLAAQCPEMVGKVVITGGAGIKKPVSESARKRTARFRRYNGMLNRLKRIGWIAPTAEKMQASLRNRYGSPDYIRLNENMRNSFVKIVSEDLYPLLADIHAPTLLIWGSGDTETPLWMAEMMEKTIPDAGLVVFEGGSHFAFVEQWRRFVVIVKQFFMEGNS